MIHDQVAQTPCERRVRKQTMHDLGHRVLNGPARLWPRGCSAYLLRADAQLLHLLAVFPGGEAVSGLPLQNQPWWYS